ncbi:hypothetical protein [Ramlibacter sp.]|uniref:hypothetical protein n=1 Tax=Ramlibacter sp. TaxID=1917967 RepID=UPI003D1413F7
MRTFFLCAAAALMAFGATAHAQTATTTDKAKPVAQTRTGGEADENRPVAGEKLTPEQRAKAREERKKQTAAANKAGQLSGGEAKDSDNRPVAAAKVSKEESAKAREERKKQTAMENKSGQIPKATP